MNEEELRLEDVLKRLVGRPLLREFALWLYEEECYDPYGIEQLLCKPWDGAYPATLLGEDLLTDIGSFLYWMARFAVEKVYGEDHWKAGNTRIRIVPEPSYEDASYVYLLEMNTRSVLAVGCGHKTWHHVPDSLEEDLEDLVDELGRSKGMLSLRMLTDA